MNINKKKKSEEQQEKRWPILQKCHQEFLQQVRRFIVVGKSAEDVVLITKDDKVYGYGKNEFNILGLGDSGSGTSALNQDSKTEPKEIVELSGKKICQISYGYYHCIALAKNGDLWSWGRNSDGQCGDGGIIDCSKPKLVIENDVDRIEMICSGARHNMLLTRSGKVMSWGANNCGQLGLAREVTVGSFLPKKIEQLKQFRVVSIAAGSYHSIALTDKGKVFLWGWNESGQIGNGDFEDKRLPVAITIPRKSFRSIAAGHWHSLLLTKDGDIYAFGSNICGQLGCQTEEDKQSIPILVNRDGADQFRAVCVHANLSAALSEESGCWTVWGDLANTGYQTRPLVTELSSIEHVFADFHKDKSTPKLIQYRHRECQPNPVMKRIGSMFDRQCSSNLKLCVGKKPSKAKPDSPSNTIYVHRGLLQITSRYFDRLLSESWCQNKDTIYINDYSFPVYRAYFKFLYTGDLDVEDLRSSSSFEHSGSADSQNQEGQDGDFEEDDDDNVNSSLSMLIDLLDLSNCYLDDELKEKCVSILKEKLSVTNFSRLYRLAIRYELKQFEKYVIEFVLQNTLRVFSSESHYLMNDVTNRMIIDLGELSLIDEQRQQKKQTYDYEFLIN